jgi:hypothetical protein
MIKTGLIAPCGMNCGVCMAFLREKDKCPGCRGDDKNKKVSCQRCKIKNCVKAKFCFSCEKYPCEKLKHLDKRYRTKYGMSMVENLGNIRNWGIRKFVRNEKIRWACSECGGIICVHRRYCYKCGKTKE